jgi:hypothetical protein
MKGRFLLKDGHDKDEVVDKKFTSHFIAINTRDWTIKPDIYSRSRIRSIILAERIMFGSIMIVMRGNIMRGNIMRGGHERGECCLCSCWFIHLDNDVEGDNDLDDDKYI